MAELKQRAFSLLRKPAEKGRQTHSSPATQHEDFGGRGVDFSVKLVGKRVLPVARGETIAHAAMAELKQEQQASGTHKQKMVINLSLSGIKLCDEKSQNVYVEHPIKNISFITIEPDDPKWFAYIAAEKAQGTNLTFMLYCLKSEKQAPLITASMMRLFKFAHQMYKRQQKQQAQKQQQQDIQERSQSFSDTPASKTTVLHPRDDLFAEDPNYASLNDVQKAIPVSASKRTSLSLIDFTATAEAPPPPPPERKGNEDAIYQVPRQSSGEAEIPDRYTAVNIGLKDSFNMEMYGLQMQSVDEPASLPAPIGVPFIGAIASPFEEAFSSPPSKVPVSHAASVVSPFEETFPLPPTKAPVSQAASEQAVAPQPEASPEQFWKHQGARQSTIFSFDPLSVTGASDTSVQLSSMNSPEKQKPPPIPPSRRDMMLSGKEKNSAVRASTSYDTPHMPPIPAGSNATTNLEGLL